jgi:hypothetical protein
VVNLANWAVADCDLGDCTDMAGLAQFATAVISNFNQQTFDEGHRALF